MVRVYAQRQYIMTRHRLTILTPTIRPEGAIEAARSIQVAHAHPLDIRHTIAYYPDTPDPMCGATRAEWATKLISDVRDGWLMWLDDDNRLHPDLPRRLAGLIDDYPDAWAFVFDCQYPGVHGDRIRATPGTMRPGSIDGGQVVWWWYLAQEMPWPTGECSDGQYTSMLYQKHRSAFVFVNEPLTYHNHQAWT